MERPRDRSTPCSPTGADRARDVADATLARIYEPWASCPAASAAVILPGRVTTRCTSASPSRCPSPRRRHLQRAPGSGSATPSATSIPPHVTLLRRRRRRVGRPRSGRGHLARVAASVDPFRAAPAAARHLPTGVAGGVRAGRRGASPSARSSSPRSGRGPLAATCAFTYHPHVTVAHDIDEAALDRAFADLPDFEARSPSTRSLPTSTATTASGVRAGLPARRWPSADR